MPYDVFISFKNSDANGRPTKESITAKRLYDSLTANGLNVFFSNAELENTGKGQYSIAIDEALDSSMFLIAVGSSHDHLNSKWVRYEWESFLNDVRSEIKPNAEVFVVFEEMKTHELPRALRQQQAFDAADSGAFERLYNFIKNAQALATGKGLEQQSKLAFTESSAIPVATTPATLPLNNLPERNQYFSGRESQLNDIHAAFNTGSAGIKKQTITGLGGVGKTQTAIEFAWRFISQYRDAVWLVNAETEMTMWSSCMAFAGAAGIITEDADETKELTPKQLADDMKSWFASHNSWLFIIDNLEDDKVVAPYISDLQSGHLLITTRTRELALGKQIGIEFFTTDEAVLFMRERLSENADLIDDDAALHELIGIMNCFPLALEQAAAYMRSAGRNCSNYLALLEKRGTLETLTKTKSALKSYQFAVTETLFLSFDKLGVSAGQLFNLCAYMSPDVIPLAFFGRQAEKLPDPLREDFGGESDDFEQDEIIKELLDYSLVKRDGDYLSLHRLVQEIRRDQIKDSGTDWLGVCLDAVINDFLGIAGFNSHEQREQFARIADHGLSIAVLAERAYINNADKEAWIGFLYYLLGCGNLERARYEQALLWLEKSLALYDRSLGNDHIYVSFTCGAIASICDRQRNNAKALEWRLKGLDICEKALGEGNPSTISLYGSISLTYASLNDYGKALEFSKKASVICEKELGMEHPDTAGAYKSTAFIYNILGDYPEAMEWSLKALSISVSTLGEEHQSTASIYGIIAGICYNQGDYPGALEWYKKALVVYEKIFGAEHPDTATTYNDIAKVSRDQGDYSGALEWYRKALAIREKVLGAEHPDTAETYRGMAYVCCDQGDYAGAQELLRSALATYGKALDVNHPSVAEVYDCFAMTCQKQGDSFGALEWYRKALAIREEAPGMDNFYAALTYSGIALVLLEQGDCSGALEWYEKSYRIMLSSLGDPHPNLAPIKANMEIAYHGTNPDEPFEKWLDKKFFT